MRPKSLVSKELKKILVHLKDKPDNISKLTKLMSGRLYDEAFRYLGDHHQSIEAVNHTLSRLWEKSGNYSEERPALPYVLSVLRNRCRDILRARDKKHKSVSIDSIPEPSYLTCAYSEEFLIDSDLSGWDWEVARKICLDRMSLLEIQQELNLSPEQLTRVIESIRATLSS
jgi:DNA-directed RNA polymerase specialized sigma24 family protein